VSKAFTKDDDGAAELLVVPRAPLPDGTPNYVTPRGLRRLQTEQTALERERIALEGSNALDRLPRLNALGQRAVELQARLAGAELVDPRSQPQDCVRFGAEVRVRHESGEQSSYRIVGVDEADAAAGLLAFTAPLARALLGTRVGDLVELRTPRHREELEVLEIGYEAGEL